MHLLLLGPQGCGKGTQANLLIEKIGLQYFAMGDALRAEVASGSDVGKQIKATLDAGDLVPNEITDNLVKKFVREADAGYIVDGYPRNIEQARFFDSITKVDAVLVLLVPDDESVKRLLKRGRSDDKEEAIRNRLKIYHEKTQVVVDHYKDKVITINGDQTIEEVHQEIMAKLQEAGLTT